MNSENKKRKFNILDLIIIVVFVLAVCFVGAKLLHIGEKDTPLQKFRITYYEEECPDFVPEHTHVGDALLDGKENLYLGTVTNIEVDESRTFHYNESTEETVVSSREGYCSVMITGEVEGTMTANGVVVGGELYAPGHTMVLYAGMGKYYLVVYEVEPVD